MEHKIPELISNTSNVTHASTPEKHGGLSKINTSNNNGNYEYSKLPWTLPCTVRGINEH